MPFGEGFSEHEPDLAIGSVSGVREFRLTSSPLGRPAARLSGVRGIWHPGENQAACLDARAVVTTTTTGHSYRPHTFGEIPHQRCGCGFWAYWSARNANAMPSPDVLAVVEGWGTCRTGTRGFRCSKARLTAIHVYSRGRPEEWLVMAEQALMETYQVPAYSSAATMLKAHPTTRPEEDTARYAQGDVVIAPTGILCMTCHRVTATTMTVSPRWPQPVMHCYSCLPQLCDCGQHAARSPSRSRWARPGATRLGLSAARALGILDAKRDGP